MFQIVSMGNFYYYDKPCASKKGLTQVELADAIDRMMKHHRTFEIYYNGEKIACGDETGVYTIGKKRKKINFRA